MIMSYSISDRDLLVAEYTAIPTQDTVNKMVILLEKSKRSIVGKLSKEGIYRREVYRTKRGAIPVTKAELVIQISDIQGLELLEGLEKAPKQVLETLLKSLTPPQ